MGGLFGFKMKETRLAQMIKDVNALDNTFKSILTHVGAHFSLELLHFINDLLNTQEEDLLMMVELGVKQNPTSGLHVYEAFEACLLMRGDISKKQRNALLEGAELLVLSVGEP